MSKYKAVLFDFDGTIIDTNDLVIGSLKYTVKTVLGVDAPSDSFFESFGKPLGEVLDCYINKVYKTNFDVEELKRIYRSYSRLPQAEKACLMDGAIDCFKALKEKGIKLAIVTSRMNASLEENLKNFKVFEYFDVLIGENNTTIHKPNPYPVKLACDMLKLDPKDCLMVGDSVVDIKAGSSAGCDTAFVSFSRAFSVDDAIAISHPTYVIDKLTDLVNINK